MNKKKKKRTLHHIFLKKVNDKEAVIIFQRDRMSRNMFLKKNHEGYYFHKETYQKNKSRIVLEIKIKSPELDKLFSVSYKNLKISGDNNDFRIAVKSDNISIADLVESQIKETILINDDFLECRCKFEGKFSSWPVLVGNRITKNKIDWKENDNSDGKRKIPEHIVKSCSYYKNKTCVYFDDMCNPYSVKCKHPDILLQMQGSDSSGGSNLNGVGNPNGVSGVSDSKEKSNNENKSQTNKGIALRHVDCVVLLNNRRCIHKEHSVMDMTGIIRVAAPQGIIKMLVPVAYCSECNQYIMLKQEFIKLKEKGVLLCEVIDKTREYFHAHKGSGGAESRIHRLGYNVMKKYEYTYEQRKLILANMLENYEVSKHEILSIIDMNLARHGNQKNYDKAVAKWREDREFVTAYQHGDCPEVIIDRLVVGGRR